MSNSCKSICNPGRPRLSVQLCLASALVTGLAGNAALAQDLAEQDKPAERAPDDRAIVVLAPGNGQDSDEAVTIDRDDMSRGGKPDALAALTRASAGITLQAAQGNPWQPNLVYRGFVASPLQGAAQGIAVYLDGGRFNQSFGDTVGFDLLPDAAIRSMTLLDASPVYGFNALGGALAIETATGVSDPGLAFTLTGGSYGEREASIAAGRSDGRFSWFVAGQARREDGWRDYSPSQLVNGYADVGIDLDQGGMHAKAVLADTQLTGNGTAPVDLLAVRRASVFTWPDQSRSRYSRFSLHPWFAFSEETRIQATVYRQRLNVSSLNGDAADIESCDETASALCIEDEDDQKARIGAPAARSTEDDDDPVYGLLNRATAKTRSWGFLAQLVDTRDIGAGDNHLAIGASYDTGTTDFVTSAELGLLRPDRSVGGLGYFIGPGEAPIGPVSLITYSRVWGAFVSDTLPITSRLRAEIGVRWNKAWTVLDDRIGADLDGEHEYERVNPGIELDWTVAPGLTVRAGYAETNRIPTPAELSCADETAPCSLANFFVADPPLKQVVARSFEVGAAGSATLRGWAIEGLLSLYKTNNSNDIVHVASRIRGRAYFLNIGRTRRQGAEIGVKARRAGWTLAASYAFINATNLSDVVLSSPNNPFADPETGTITASPGDRLPGIPRHSMLVSIDREMRLGKQKVTLGGDMITRSSQILFGDEANLTRPIPGYTLFNLRGGVEMTTGVSLTLEVRNLFNRSYASFGSFGEVGEVPLAEAPDASNPQFYGPGTPRRWSLGLSARF